MQFVARAWQNPAWLGSRLKLAPNSRREELQEPRIAVHRRGAAFKRDASAIEHVSVIGDPQRELEMLLDDDDGDLLDELLQALGDLLDDADHVETVPFRSEERSGPSARQAQ